MFIPFIVTVFFALLIMKCTNFALETSFKQGRECLDENKCSQQKQKKKMKSLNHVNQKFSEENSGSKTLNSYNISSDKVLKSEECCPVYQCDKLSSLFVDVGSDFIESDYLLEEDDNIYKVNSEILFADHKDIDYNLIKSVKIEQNIEVSRKQNDSVQNVNAAVFNISDICTSNDIPGVSTIANVENVYDNSDDYNEKPSICLDYSRTTKVVSVSGGFEKINKSVKEEEGELVYHSTKNIHSKIEEELVSDEVSIINESIINTDLYSVNKLEELPNIGETNMPVLSRSCSGYSATFEGEEYVQKLCLADENMKVNNKNDEMDQIQRNWKFKHATDRHYFCEVCSKGFMNLHSLNIHKCMHTGDRSFNCDVCGIAFAQMAYLEKHKLKHTSDRPYGCDMCGKTYTQPGHLIKHKRMHTGERPYGCDMCGKAFTQQDILTKHKRIHTGDRPFVCTICGKAFTQKANLIKHNLIHTGVRPFHCSICDKTFSQLSKLKSHKLTHTGDKPFDCSICGRAFAYVSSLKRHKRIHTG